jgi:hypothetical protein
MNEAVAAHLARTYDPPDLTWHGIHVITRKPNRPVYVLVTATMSEHPMAGDRYAELMLILPPSWPAPGTDEFENGGADWPYLLLEELAAYPHASGKVLWSGHTVANGDPPMRYGPDTDFCGALVAPQVLREQIEPFQDGDHQVKIFAVWPLYADELEYKLEHGADELAGLIDDARLLEVVKVGRPSVVPAKRKGRGPFWRR